VEDLQGERPGIPRPQHVPHEPGDVEATLPGEAAIVATPLQDVHRKQRSIRELQKEDLLARDVLDALEVGPTGKNMKTVETGTERRMTGRLDNVPGMVVRTDMASPGKRLVGDPDTEVLCQIGKLTQL